MRTAYKEHPHPAGLGGWQRLYKFENGWGASVIRGRFSHGGDKGLWELGVIKWTGDDYELNYEHPVAEGDVRGHLTEDKVDELLDQIEATK